MQLGCHRLNRQSPIQAPTAHDAPPPVQPPPRPGTTYAPPGLQSSEEMLQRLYDVVHTVVEQLAELHAKVDKLAAKVDQLVTGEAEADVPEGSGNGRFGCPGRSYWVWHRESSLHRDEL